MKYYDCNVNLTKAQAKKLAKGMKVRLKHQDLTGQHHVLLTKSQMTKMTNRKAQGKGMDIQMSLPQIEGSGFLDFLKDAGNWIKNAGETVYNKVLKPIGEKVIIPVGKKLAQRYMDNPENIAGDIEKVGMYAKLLGAGVRGRGRGRGRRVVVQPVRAKAMGVRGGALNTPAKVKAEIMRRARLIMAQQAGGNGLWAPGVIP